MKRLLLITLLYFYFSQCGSSLISASADVLAAPSPDPDLTIGCVTIYGDLDVRIVVATVLVGSLQFRISVSPHLDREEPKIVWTVNNLKAVIAPTGRNQIHLIAPALGETQIEQKLLATGYGVSRGIVFRTDGVSAVVIKDHIRWLFHNGLLTGMEDGNAHVFNVSTIGGLVSEITSADSKNRTVLHAEFTEEGHLANIKTQVDKTRLSWTTTGLLERITFDGKDAGTVEFKYENDLLTSIIDSRSGNRNFTWEKEPRWRRGLRPARFPARLSRVVNADGTVDQFSYQVTQRGYEVESHGMHYGALCYNPFSFTLNRKTSSGDYSAWLCRDRSLPSFGRISTITSPAGVGQFIYDESGRPTRYVLNGVVRKSWQYSD